VPRTPSVFSKIETTLAPYLNVLKLWLRLAMLPLKPPLGIIFLLGAAPFLTRSGLLTFGS
jgi:hypothetical protein